MPRKPIEKSNTFPYHICARSNNKDWYKIPLPDVLSIYVKVLKKTKALYSIRTHAFVLMANHFHMLITTPEANVSESMRYFMTETSRRIARASGRINRIYGARYSWTIIKESEHYSHSLKYVLKNPIKHNVVVDITEYEYSSIQRTQTELYKLIDPHPESFDDYVPVDENELIQWLNMKDDENYLEDIRLALRRSEFKFRRDKKTGKKIHHIDKLRCKKSIGT